MGNGQFNSYRSGNYSSRYDTNDFSPSRNAYSRGETRDRNQGAHTYGNSEYFSNQGRSDRDENNFRSGQGSSWSNPSDDRNQSSYGSGAYERNRHDDNDRGFTDRAGDEVRSWFGDDDAERRRRQDDRRDNDSWGSSNSQNRYGSSQDRYDNSRTISSGRYENSDDNRTGYGSNDRSGYNNVYGSSYGRSNDNDRYSANRYGSSSDRYDRDRSRNDDDDRGFFNRAGDEVRSWFGDDEAERRRRMDDLRDYDNDRDSNRDRNAYRRNSSTYTSGPPYSYGSSSRRDYEW